MSVLRVHLFGKFDACYGDRPVAGLDTRKVQELFCYLLLYRDRPHPREALASLLWDESHAEQPVRCLRKTLWQLRTALDAQSESFSGRVLLIEPEWIQINPEADLWLDAAEFEQAFACIQGVPGWEFTRQQVQALQGLVDLYGGGMQENWYCDWYLLERERFQHMYLIILDKLMAYCEAHCEYEAGLAYGALILRCERSRERTHRRLMRLHYVAGYRSAALRQFESCVTVLREDLGVQPARRTLALYEQIQQDQLNIPVQLPSVSSQVSDVAAFPIAGMIPHLKQLQVALNEVQRQLSAIFEVWR
jgi:DNA-binding SARP family transcriptional activator